ncbi:MAG: glycosyltransferase, partial [bacterium]|nr:glycosyltransferase [bacterium]
PTVKGDKLRAWHFIRALSQAHQVTLLTYLRSEQERQLVPDVERVCRVVTVPFEDTRQLLGLRRGLRSRVPFQVLLYESSDMKRAVTELLPDVDVVHLNTLRMMGNLPPDCTTPLVVDFIDALSATYAKQETPPPLGWFYKAEARRLRACECTLATRATFSTAVSEEDARRLSPVVSVVPHAVDTDVFSPPTPDTERKGIVFTGNLRYPPNVEAAVWFVRNVFPKVRARVPETSLRLVGAQPARAVQSLAGDGVEVTGFVPSVAEELRRAAVAVAPVRSGSGVKTKVLEAMACGTPVVATPEANAGINAEDGKETLLAGSPDAFAEAVLELMSDSGRAAGVGAAGRALVEERFGLDVMGRILLERYAKLAKDGTLNG